MKPPKQLQRLWNKKLKASGFQDAEKDGKLKDFHALSFSRILPEELEEKQRYFALANELGNGYQDEWGNWVDVFSKHPKDKRVWLEHCKGLGESEVATKCGISSRTVRRIIAKYNKYIVRI